jgi:hypothetical protein
VQAAADDDRLVERAPAVGPVVGDLRRADLHEGVARRRLEVGQRRQLARRAVDRVLDDVAQVDLLDADGASASSSASAISASSRRTASARPDHFRQAAQPAHERLVHVELLGPALESASSRSSSALLLVQAARDLHVDDRVQVAGAAAPLQRRHAGAAHLDRVARLRAGRDLELDLGRRRAFERDGRPERGTRRRNVDDRDEVVAFAHEALVLEHVATSTYRSPGGPPDSPAWPRPPRRMRWPSAMPAGTSTRSERRRTSRPRPSQRSHGSSGTLPSPPQTSQVTLRTICPNGERVTACSMPAPPQRSQVSIGVPGSAPLPWQRSQVSMASKLSSSSSPVAACSSVISALIAMSPPARGPWRAAVPPPNPIPPKNASNRSLIEPNELKSGPIPPLRRPSWP